MQLQLEDPPAFELELRDAQGAAVGDAEVAIIPADAGAPVEWARADAGGRVALYGRHLREQPHAVLVQAYLPDANRSEFRVLSPSDTALRIVIGEDGSASVDGKVLTTEGKPVPGARVVARLRGPVPPRDGVYLRTELTGRDAVATRSASDGTFRLSGLRRDRQYRLLLEVPEELEWRESAPVLLSGSTGVILTVAAPVHLTGRVVLANGEPVRVFRIDGAEHAASDGRFKARLYTDGIRVSAEGLMAHWLAVPRVRDTDVGEVVLTPVPTLRGRVLSASGTPVTGAKVVLGPYLTDSTRTNEDGAFRLSVPHALPLALHVSASEGRRAVLPVTTLRDVEVVLAEPGTVRGTVSRPGSAVSAVCKGGLELSAQSAGTRFALQLPPGRCWIGADGHLPQQVEILSGQGVEVALPRREGSGRVFVLHPGPSHYVSTQLLPGDVPTAQLADAPWALLPRELGTDPPDGQVIVGYPTETVFPGLPPGLYTAFVIDERIERRVIEVKPGFNFVDMDWSPEAPPAVRGPDGELQLPVP